MKNYCLSTGQANMKMLPVRNKICLSENIFKYYTNKSTKNKQQILKNMPVTRTGNSVKAACPGQILPDIDRRTGTLVKPVKIPLFF